MSKGQAKKVKIINFALWPHTATEYRMQNNWHFSKTISVVLNNFIYNKKPLSHQEKSFNLVVLLNQLSM